MDEDTKHCPFCAETIKKAAIVCRYCGRDLVELPRAEAGPPSAPPRHGGGVPSARFALILMIGSLTLIAIGLWSLGKALAPYALNNGQDPSRNASSAYSSLVASGPTRQYAGRGKDITPNWSSQGFIIVKMTHSGQRNFTVWLKDSSSANSRELLANEIGPYSGTRVALEQPGQYFFGIEADGSWGLTVMEPGHLRQREQGPYQFQGQGPDVPAVFRLERGRVDTLFSHQGNRNFVVWLYDVTRGSRVELLANEIGTWQGRTASNVQGGWYLLDVDADGAWTVRMSQ